MLKYKVEYDPLSVNEYQKQYEAQQVKYMKKRAAKLGLPIGTRHKGRETYAADRRLRKRRLLCI